MALDTAVAPPETMLRHLNPKRLAAVALSAQILANAGSGKTRALTTRIA